MSNNLENPFLPSHGAKPNLSALAEQGFLPPDEVAKLRELEDQKDRSSKFDVRNSLSGVSLKEGMTAQERGSLKESQEETRKELIEWADKWDLGDEDWVDETFDFQSNGTVVCNRNLNLSKMTEADFPDCIFKVTGYLNLQSLTSAEHLNLPASLGGDLDLRNLASAEHLNLPTTIGGTLDLRGLTSAEHLNLPTTIRGNLYLQNVTTAEHLNLPTTIGSGLYLPNLTSAEHLNLPTTIGGDLNLFSLTSAEYLKLPPTIFGSLYLQSLTSAEHLNLPPTIGGTLDLRSLTSAEHLVLTDIKGAVYLDSLPEQEKQQLRKKYPDLTIE